MRTRKASPLVRVFGSIFGVCIVLIFVLALALSFAQHVSGWSALYSTALSALLVGPTIIVTSGPAQAIVVFSVVDGLIMVEVSIALAVMFFQSYADKIETKEIIRDVIAELRAQSASPPMIDPPNKKD
jgi:hypothetical protein